MTQFISRAYNSFEVDDKNRSVIVKISKERRLFDEHEYYDSLPKPLSVYFPRVFDFFQDSKGFYVMQMEYYAYDNLGSLMINKQYDRNTWRKAFQFLFTFLNSCKAYSLQDSGFESCASMYIEKTEREYKNLVENFEYFKSFDQEREITLNGQKLKSFGTIWPKIKQYLESSCLTNSLNYIHGDLCYSNILYGINPINSDVVLKFIDPRGSFGKVKSYGDTYYDLAKLAHSSYGGYEYFITDNFTISENFRNYVLEFSNDNKSRVHEEFKQFVDQYGYDQLKIDILQGTIFVGMCARHYDSITRQKAMLLTGLKLLNDVYEKI